MMRIKLISLIQIGVFVLGFIAILYPTISQAQQESGLYNSEEPPILSELLICNKPDGSRILLRSNKYFDFIPVLLEREEGPVFVINPLDTVYCKMEREFIPAQEGLVSKVKINIKPGKAYNGFYPIESIALELKNQAPHDTYQKENLIGIDIGDVGLPALPPKPPTDKLRAYISEDRYGKAMPIEAEFEELEEYYEEPWIAKEPEEPWIAEEAEELWTAEKPEEPEEPWIAEEPEEPWIAEEPEELWTAEKPEEPEEPWIAEEPEEPEEPWIAEEPEEPKLEPIEKPEPPELKPARALKLPEPKVTEGPGIPIYIPQIGEIEEKEATALEPIKKVKLPEPATIKRLLSSTYKMLEKGETPVTFEECLKIASDNYVPLLIAEEEINLAQMKVAEARRAIYPQAIAKYTYTEGDIYGVGFRELTRGFQVEQPVYYGGRLQLAFRQAKVNREVVEEKYAETEAEMVATVTEKFYEFMASQLHLVDQKDLVARAEEIYTLAQKRYDKGLSTKVELLNVQSQVNQVGYQLAVADKELELAKIALLQAMGADPSSDIQMKFDLDFDYKDIDLNDCLDIAFRNRPEVHVHQFLLEGSRIEESIARSKDAFKVDFSGFIGESGGAYNTEDLELDTDWFVGVKVNKPFGTNTASYQYSKTDTSAKLGQTTRTGSATHSVEFSLLDNLASLSEKQTALIGKMKAENELVELKKSINMEVREAYANYQKAVLQLHNTAEKIKFREEELKITEARAALNEMALSQLLDANIKLVDEKALHHQSVASYKTALANLNKAVGLIGYFD